MTVPWTTRAEREATLAQLDARLRSDPLSLGAGLDRARMLVELDRIEEARDAYLRILARAPDEVRALSDFGTLLLKTGYRAAARTAYERAVAVAPRAAVAHANLGNVLFALGEFDAARARYEEALRLDPTAAQARQGLSYALTRLGREEEAAIQRRAGFAHRAVTTGTYRGATPPIDVLSIVSAAGGTLYTDDILDDRVFRTTTLVADAYDGTPLPPAAVAFNAIGDADRAHRELAAMEALPALRDLPVINPPAAVLATSRRNNAARLARLAGVVAPRIAAVPRAELSRSGGAAILTGLGFAFPLLVRAPGFHSGAHFTLVERPGELAAAVAGFPGEDVLAIEYLDLRDDDGYVHKYRMMFVDGRPYPMHLAISDRWKVHYFTAGMAANAAHRAGDAAFLNDPAGVLGPHAFGALRAIADLLALDYMGIDFAIDRDGRVVVFEANATMIVLQPGPEPIWEYRRPHVQRIIDAARTMVAERAR